MNYRTSALSKSAAERVRAPELRTLFPKVIEMRLELEFSFDARRPPSNQTHILHPAASAHFTYPCPIYGCTGEFRLDQAATRLMRQSLAGAADEIGCTGVRPQDRVSGKPCGTRLKFKIDALYDAIS